MKRIRFPALILALLLAVALWVSPRSQAATYNGETVYYTVINDALIDLTYASMPISRNGIIYVPYTVFPDNFEIRATYSSEEQILFLSNGDEMLKFDVRSQKTYDNHLKELRQPALIAKGQVFVPAQFTANYLGLGYVYLADSNIVRMGDYRVSYPDAFLASYLEDEMTAALANLISTGGTTAPPPASSTTASTVHTPRNLYFSFLSASPENTQALMTILDRWDIRAAFFMDGNCIESAPLCPVQLRVNGQIPGIYTDVLALPQEPQPVQTAAQQTTDADISLDSPVDTLQVLAAVEAVNDRYYALLREKSRLLLLDNADSPELRSLGRSAGFLSLSPTLRIAAQSDAQTLITDILAQLEAVQGDVLLLLPDDPVTVQAFPQLIAALQQLEFTLSDMDALGAGFAE